MTQPSPWWHPDRHADRRPFLLARARILSAIRRAFEADGFLEVESGALQVSPGNETHLHGFATDWIAPDGATSRLYLHTSPEFGCKKLLAAGEDRIFAVARFFGTGRSALCTIRNSPCWNGTGRVSGTSA